MKAMRSRTWALAWVAGAGGAVWTAGSWARGGRAQEEEGEEGCFHGGSIGLGPGGSLAGLGLGWCRLLLFGIGCQGSLGPKAPLFERALGSVGGRLLLDG